MQGVGTAAAMHVHMPVPPQFNLKHVMCCMEFAGQLVLYGTCMSICMSSLVHP